MKRVIVPLFIPHLGCPHRCVFCNQHGMTGVVQTVAPPQLKGYVNGYLSRIRNPAPPPAGTGRLRSRERGNGSRRVQLAFYGGSFTGLPEKLMREYLRAARALMEEGLIEGVRLSTRPDCISPHIAALLKGFGVEAVELGIQSLADSVLEASGRGHTSDDSLRAIALLKEHGFRVGAQLMTGLPGAGAEDDLETAERLITARPHFARIYPTLVMRGTELENLYRSGRYSPASLEEAVELCSVITERLEESGIGVIRLGVQQTAELCEGSALIAGPHHPSFGLMVRSRIAYRRVSSALEGLDTAGAEMELSVHPSEVSTYRGIKSSNAASWRESYDLGRVSVIPSEGLRRGGFRAVLKR